MALTFWFNKYVWGITSLTARIKIFFIMAADSKIVRSFHSFPNPSILVCLMNFIRSSYFINFINCSTVH